jgi:cyclopropane fatty-acyl-phospholipid synthase-like methyltransferase
MKQSTTADAVAKYYSRMGSRLGYRLVMKNSQHFGYYDKTYTNETEAQEKFHQEFADLLDLKPGMKILDAGCGQGVVASYLAAHFDVAVTGITITPYEVGSAKRNARSLGVQDRTHFILADYATPPFEIGSFDRIYTTETLSHAEDVAGVLAGFYKLPKSWSIYKGPKKRWFYQSQ